MSFEEVPHTADIKIRAHAPTLETLFSEACEALMQVMYGKERRAQVTADLDVDAADTESLLADFLSEVLFRSEVDGVVFSASDIRITGTHLHAVMNGEPFDPAACRWDGGQGDLLFGHVRYAGYERIYAGDLI